MRRILIVDDHPGFRAHARKLLESDGFAVVGEAADGDEAVALTHELGPDVVLLDVQLPDVDGFEVAKRLSLNGESPMVVLISSRDESDFGSLLAAAEIGGFIAKDELSGARLRAVLA